MNARRSVRDRRWVDEEHCREQRDHKPRPGGSDGPDGSDSPLSPDSDELLEKLLIAMCILLLESWANNMTNYPIINQRTLPKASRRGPMGLVPPRREASELPLPNAHEAVVYKTAGAYSWTTGGAAPPTSMS